MKIIRNKFLSTYNGILAMLLAMLGFASSCDSVDEYGVPSAKFIVKGKVTSQATSLPIKNIRVVLESDTAITDSNGNYEVVDENAFPESKTYMVRFLDLDGEQNGAFNNLDSLVEFIDPQFTNGSGSWYSGETSKEIDAKLKPKE